MGDTRQSRSESSADLGPRDNSAEQATATSRRELLSVGAKLMYVVPFVQVFCATALAAGSQGSGPSCLAMGELCASDSDCCSGECLAGLCN